MAYVDVPIFTVVTWYGSSSAVYSAPSVTYDTRDGTDGLLTFMIKTLSSPLDVDIRYVEPSITV